MSRYRVKCRRNKLQKLFDQKNDPIRKKIYIQIYNNGCILIEERTRKFDIKIKNKVGVDLDATGGNMD